MSTVTIFDKCKTALRISHTVLDGEITDQIATARLEMVRVGISSSKANDDSDALIVSAIKTYVLSRMANSEEDREGYEKSWLYQLDNLRKSRAYNTEAESNV